MEGVKEKLEQMEGFQMEMEEVTEKLGQMEVKSARLEREIGFLKAKEQTLGQQLGKNAPAIKENQTQPKGQRKGLEKSTEPKEEGALSAHCSRIRGSTPALRLSPSKDTNNRNHASVAASKPA